MFRQGDRVRHRGWPEWDLGQVLEDHAGGRVKVRFAGAGERQLSLSHVVLEKLEGDEARHSLLDNLNAKKGGRGRASATLQDLISRFRLLRDVITPARTGGNNHPKVERVVREACDAMLCGEKMIIFCERNETVHAIKRRCDRVWEAHILRLWLMVFPSRGARDVWHQQRNYQK